MNESECLLAEVCCVNAVSTVRVALAYVRVIVWSKAQQRRFHDVAP